jgi:hypothetical protein
MAQDTAKAVGAKLLGVKLVVLDEISMINLETLYDISERQKIAMGTQTCDVNERKLIYTKHFGGVHVLFTGDFYQLKPIGGEAIYTTNVKNNISLKGKKIWNDLNEFVILTENTRYMGDATPIMNQFLSGARKGMVDLDLLHAMNSRVVYTKKTARRDAGPDAIWIAHSNYEVDEINAEDYKAKVTSGARHFKIEAEHRPIIRGTKRPDKKMLKSLRGTVKPGMSPFYLELAIGSRVSCTKNLGTQIGKNFLLNRIFVTYLILLYFWYQVYTMARKEKLWDLVSVLIQIVIFQSLLVMIFKNEGKFLSFLWKWIMTTDIPSTI